MGWSLANTTLLSLSVSARVDQHSWLDTNKSRLRRSMQGCIACWGWLKAQTKWSQLRQQSTCTSSTTLSTTSISESTSSCTRSKTLVLPQTAKSWPWSRKKDSASTSPRMSAIRAILLLILSTRSFSCLSSKRFYTQRTAEFCTYS